MRHPTVAHPRGNVSPRQHSIPIPSQVSHDDKRHLMRCKSPLPAYEARLCQISLPVVFTSQQATAKFVSNSSSTAAPDISRHSSNRRPIFHPAVNIHLKSHHYAEETQASTPWSSSDRILRLLR